MHGIDIACVLGHKTMQSDRRIHIAAIHRTRETDEKRGRRLLLVLLRLLLGATVGLEGLDLGLDAGLALGERKAVDLVLEGLRLPVLGLLGGLEGRVLTNGSVGVGVDLLDVLGANAVGKVGRELLLEAAEP